MPVAPQVLVVVTPVVLQVVVTLVVLQLVVLQVAVVRQVQNLVPVDPLA